MKILKKIIGVLVYTLTKNFNLRYFFPDKFSVFIEELRIYALILQGANIGKGTYVRSGGFIAYPQNLTLGKRVKIAENCQLYNYDKVFVGDDTEIGSNLYVQTNEHKWQNKNLPLAKQGAYSSPVSVGSGVYIGANVTILRGVQIADRCIVAAGAVVTKNTEVGFIYGGIPAKKISKIH